MWSYNYTFQYSYSPTLCHHGKKGQKWGVRNGPPYPLKRDENKVENSKKSGIIKITISGHKSAPMKAEPNSIIDHISSKTGKVDKRSYYDERGLKLKDVHTTDHGNPKVHPYGKHGEHAHDYTWYKDGSVKQGKHRDLDTEERKENSDIL
ncbi:MAG: hypothetical protein LUD81_03245 [Clostridiales bacterium]|nr:hypothetical protein [Clostridiales bacterium]